MKYKIAIHAPWRPGGVRWRPSMVHPGVYRVPEDLSESMAERALKEAGATRIDLPKPEPWVGLDLPTAEIARAEATEATLDEIHHKEAAPENKTLDAAPENKATAARPRRRRRNWTEPDA